MAGLFTGNVKNDDSMADVGSADAPRSRRSADERNVSDSAGLQVNQVAVRTAVGVETDLAIFRPEFQDESQISELAEVAVNRREGDVRLAPVHGPALVSHFQLSGPDCGLERDNPLRQAFLGNRHKL